MTEQEKIFFKYMERESEKAGVWPYHKKIMDRNEHIGGDMKIDFYKYVVNMFLEFEQTIEIKSPYSAYKNYKKLVDIIEAFPAWNRQRKIKLIK